MNTAQRKRKGAQSVRSKSSKRRTSSSASRMTEETEPIELESGEEVVDLTCESSEPVVVDLTNNDLSINDSVVIVEDTPRQRRNLSRNPQQAASCILSSDDEDSRDAEGFMTNKDFSPVDNRSSASGRVSCPICMDSYPEIIQSKRLIVSTKCGHIFCSQCLRDALKNSLKCPTCRKKLNHKQYHPIYI
ncbi:hypothetical protein GDO86_000154 [Hymenochirus boettgeri]|uniref:E3 ubiquitin-protein ligase RNF4 n=1 Tax=Hymenochirus boettgeri TaxID=247094 RepID=A0A8T2KC04_9PIPI|nr:hypothetical protein GDO86_000154 [Hymenochirus boettgeri]